VLANDPLVTRWMNAGFPYPYTVDDARAWLAIATADDPPNHYVIEADGAFAGAIGIIPLSGEHRGVALFGYWLGRRYWGHGLGSDAARTLARYALRERGFRRLEASIFAPNAASARVLENAGFTLEARKRAGYVDREGNVLDELVYARLATDPEP
jgi:[ribosomal protein S5]-alanine N-acetyltransferase